MDTAEDIKEDLSQELEHHEIVEDPDEEESEDSQPEPPQRLPHL